MIEVTFLGVGAALPAPGSSNSCYFIDAGETRILFDCGPAVLQQLAAVGKTPGDATHLFVSHGHGDHALGYPMFLLWWSLERRGQSSLAPKVVASSATWAHLDALWEHAYQELPLFAVDRIVLPTHQPHRHALTSKIALSTWPMIHSTVAPVLSARFEIGDKILAFTADTARCEYVLPLARDADLLIHDSRYSVTVPPDRSSERHYHCCARDAGDYATASGARNLALVHIGAEYEDNHAGLVVEAKAQFAGHVFAPKPGDVFRV